MGERQTFNRHTKGICEEQFKQLHFSGPTPPGLSICTQFIKQCQYKGMIISCSSGNCFGIDKSFPC